MIILYIGGAGFIGNSLVPALELAGHDVVVCDNLAGTLPARVRNLKEVIKANTNDYSAMSYVFNKVQPDVVILGVGYHYKLDERYNAHKEGELILNSANVVCSLLTSRVKRVYYLSHSDVYGGPETTKPISEDRKIITSTNYRGAACLAAEKLVTQRCSEIGAQATIVRLFGILGPRVVYTFTTCRINSMIDHFIIRKPFHLAGADKKLDFLHIDDAVAAIIAIQEKGFSGIINVGSGKGIQLRKLVKELGKSIKIFIPPGELDDPPFRPTYSSVADVRLLKEVAPWWKPKVDIIDYLPDLVEFRREEALYYSSANRATVLANQRRGDT